jgi:hypothetical protein
MENTRPLADIVVTRILGSLVRAITVTASGAALRDGDGRHSGGVHARYNIFDDIQQSIGTRTYLGRAMILCIMMFRNCYVLF